jgi:hypothetical protein
MKKHRVKCRHEHRIFDAVEGSRLRIRYKCSKKKKCPDIGECCRSTEIEYGVNITPLSGVFRPIDCLNCGKRVFDASSDSEGFVNLKCDHCGNVAVIPVERI